MQEVPALIGAGKLKWLVALVALGACNADGPGTARDSGAADSGAIGGTGPAGAAIDDDSPDPPADAQPSADVITYDGWGPLRIGMTLAEVTAAAGPDANPDAVGGPDPASCDEFRPASAPNGVLVMIENGVLTRISVSRNTGIRTPEGFTVGDPDSLILARYGRRARVVPHKYQEPPAKYITIWRGSPSDTDARGILYEIGTDGVVAHLRAGGRSIEYVEGCL